MVHKLKLNTNVIKSFARHIQAVKDYIRPQDQGGGARKATLEAIVGTHRAVQDALNAPNFKLGSIKIGGNGWGGGREGGNPLTPNSAKKKEKRINKLMDKVSEEAKEVLPKEIIEKLAEHRDKRERKEKRRRLSNGGNKGA